MIKEVGADYVIIGHSERRAAGETDKDVKAKAEAGKLTLLSPMNPFGPLGQAKCLH